ncbi:hypothetical protein JHK82_052242 [Glycine max]|uniref:SWIM-type domain-containing protein n=2 Tax=Glycine subgen. Soja TaxID=1462606 RepID=K7MW32_SOYBN|nr:hypothetical protein JHK86_052070 [Glycine max]KAG4914595.1 hypothetical protein JHK87_052152 [Glycine soja]KAG5082080.1 hypothetical protein JHK84_052118 [Glycine max]KAG5084845.1 hypothetical protein JHK82_052242 [Glycine max]KAH1076074.1 hypothetical protein GYH30_051803 [Glycine max]
MITNVIESINSVLIKTRNLPISALVKSTYIGYNALFNQSGREVALMITYGQVYTQFLVQQTINPREVLLTGNFRIRVDERWCDCDKFQKIHVRCSHVVAACKHAHHECKNYKHHAYTLESVSNMYIGLFRGLCNEAY